MKRRYVVLLALLAFLVTLVLHAPAPLVYAWLMPAGGAMRVHGVHGTVAQGGFAALTVYDRPLLTDARWRLHPGWLALLRLSADVESGGESVVRVRISRAPLGALRLSDLSAAGSVRVLLGALGQPTLPVEGQARLEMPVLRIDDGAPIEAEGTAEFQNLVWRFGHEPVPLGNFTASLATEDQGVRVSLESGTGPVELEGTVMLSGQRAYEVDLKLRPRADANAHLQSAMRSLGQPDAQGFYSLRRSGTL